MRPADFKRSAACLREAKQRGVTLVELVISIVIISIAMVALLNAFGVSVSRSADPLWQNKSLKLAQLYLDEILAKAYDHSTPIGGMPHVASPSCSGLGPETGETRASYNDVDDYNGLIDAPPMSIVGALDASYAAYEVRVSVSCDGTAVSASAQNHAKRVLVQVIAPNNTQLNFAAYKGNF